MKDEEGISEIVDETLILGLVVVCAAIAGVLLLGFAIPVEKTAYVVPQFGTKDIAGKMVITVFDRGGDPVYFNATSIAKYKAAFYVDTSAGSFQAVPVSTLAVFKPGDLVYLYYTGTGFIVTKDLTGAPITTLPVGRVTVRIVDINTGTLIAGETVVQGPVTTLTVNVTPTTSGTPTANITTTIPTTIATTPATTAATTVATTTPIPTPVLYGVTVSWSPPGLGSATAPPAGTLANPRTVGVTQGSSLTVSFIPQLHSGKAVKTIKLDGVTVYSGSAANTTISYTMTNIQSVRTLAATFG